MTLESFRDWLFSDAGAGWVFGILAIIVAIVRDIRRKRRPSIITVTETDRTSLVRVRPMVGERIEVTFDGAKIANLGLVEIEMVNNGEKVIRGAHIALRFSESTKPLEARRLSEQNDADLSSEMTGPNEVTVSIPYLNPYREHQHVARLQIIVDGEPKLIGLRGDGEGWSARLTDWAGPVSLRRDLSRTWRVLIILGCFVAAYLLVADHYFSLTLNTIGIGWKILFVVPVFLILIFATTLLLRVLGRLLKRIPEGK